ncbi:hypothetical protein [Clostridium thermarum]|uniref:hypothetical protein n=1 Tax=Clostridium thermarum TaxID=1716543 RepID=UPI0013D06C54|nr:hypothetical protein [Clostridium thermarum]
MRYKIILEQKRQLEEQLRELNKRYHYIEKKTQWYEDIINYLKPDSSNPGK